MVGSFFIYENPLQSKKKDPCLRGLAPEGAGFKAVDSEVHSLVGESATVSSMLMMIPLTESG